MKEIAKNLWVPETKEDLENHFWTYELPATWGNDPTEMFKEIEANSKGVEKKEEA